MKLKVHLLYGDAPAHHGDIFRHMGDIPSILKDPENSCIFIVGIDTFIREKQDDTDNNIDKKEDDTDNNVGENHDNERDAHDKDCNNSVHNEINNKDHYDEADEKYNHSGLNDGSICDHHDIDPNIDSRYHIDNIMITSMLNMTSGCHDCHTKIDMFFMTMKKGLLITNLLLCRSCMDKRLSCVANREVLSVSTVSHPGNIKKLILQTILNDEVMLTEKESLAIDLSIVYENSQI